MPKIPKWLGDAMEGLMGSKIPLMKVISSEHITPKIKKIKLQGNISAMDFQLGYAVAIRVNDTAYRNYTPSFIDTESGILEMIVHLHANTPGSQLMNDLHIGSEIRMSMPRGKKMYDKMAKGYLFFGDETSLGLAVAFQEKLRKTQQKIHFYLALNKENEAAPRLLGLENYTLFEKRDFLNIDNLISELLSHKMLFWQDSNFVLTGNAKTVQMIRNSIKKTKITGKIFAQAYWAEGKSRL